MGEGSTPVGRRSAHRAGASHSGAARPAPGRNAAILLAVFILAFLRPLGERRVRGHGRAAPQTDDYLTSHSKGGIMAAAIIHVHAAGGAGGLNRKRFNETPYAGPAASNGNGFFQKIKESANQ